MILVKTLAVIPVYTVLVLLSEQLEFCYTKPTHKRNLTSYKFPKKMFGIKSN